MIYMVFDVESIGLHGEGFAVGWVVVQQDGVELDWGRLACDPNAAAGAHEGRVWIANNVPTILPTHNTPRAIRETFWGWWQAWKKRGAILAADVAWPVEARFLAACVDDDPETRSGQGPYPLVDISSVRLAAGFDPTDAEPRQRDELPEHDPLADARQSARLLLIALDTRQVVGAVS